MDDEPELPEPPAPFEDELPELFVAPVDPPSDDDPDVDPAFEPASEPLVVSALGAESDLAAPERLSVR